MSRIAKKKKSNGEGTVFKTKSGYRGQIVIGLNDEGKPIRRSVTGKTFKEVNEKLTAIKNSIFTGSYIAPNNITLCELARLIIKDDLNLNYIKEGTYHRHNETIKRIEKNQYMKNTPIQDLKYSSIKEYLLSETCMSQSIINKIFTMLNKVLKEAVKRNIISNNPMNDIKKPKTSQKREKVRALTMDEEMKLYYVLTTEDINYTHQMLLSMLTGMRMGEINALDPYDVLLNSNTISVTKTISRGAKGKPIISKTPKTENGNRDVPIFATAIPLVKEILLCAGKEHLFEHKGKLITTSQVNLQFQRVLEKYDIIDKRIKGKVSLHSLRHTFATRCIESGMQPKVLQHILGHSDITTTLNTYCDAFDKYQNENIAKTDEYFIKMGINLGLSGTMKEAI